MKHLFAGITALLLLVSCQHEPVQPNILWIYVDDMSD
jgi:hypothetical protein